MVRRFELAVLVGLVALVAWWSRPAGHDFRLRATFEPGSSGQQAWVVDTADPGQFSQVQVEYLEGQAKGIDFFGLEPEYVGDGGADRPTRTIEVWHKGRHHRVSVSRQAACQQAGAVRFARIWDNLVWFVGQDASTNLGGFTVYEDISVAGVSFDDRRQDVEAAWGPPQSVESFSVDVEPWELGHEGPDHYEKLIYPDREAVVLRDSKVTYLKGPEFSAFGVHVRAGQDMGELEKLLGPARHGESDPEWADFQQSVQARVVDGRVVEFGVGVQPRYIDYHRASGV
ncbi:MAG: hypothetical protein AB7S38_20050 [Vulcanimicrobiota bacterium]